MALFFSHRQLVSGFYLGRLCRKQSAVRRTLYKQNSFFVKKKSLICQDTKQSFSLPHLLFLLIIAIENFLKLAQKKFFIADFCFQRDNDNVASLR